jgi:subtilase family serine protease
MRRTLLAAVLLTTTCLPYAAAARAPLAPAWAAPASAPAFATAAALVGPVPDDAVVEVSVVLPLREEAALRALVARVSDPASPSYRSFLTTDAFRARFAPTPAQALAVAGWLSARGLEVGTVPAGRAFVPARGPARVVERAFATELGLFRDGDRLLRAPLTGHLVPPGAVGVRGLADEPVLEGAGEPTGTAAGDEPFPVPLPDMPATPADSTPPTAVVYAAPCSSYDGQVVPKGLPRFGRSVPAAVSCGTTVAQQRKAYGADRLLAKGVDGSGQTVVVVGSHAIQTLPGDVAEWSERRGLPAMKPGQLTQLSYPTAYQTPTAEPVLRPQVWALQSHMIVENIHAMAPGADVVYLGTTSSLDLTNGTTLAVDAHLGDVVMNGWYSAGENSNPATMAQVEHTAMQAAAQGISLLFATGSIGDLSSQGQQPSPVSPATEPLVTAVGATSLVVDRRGGLREVGWAKAQLLLEDGVWEDAAASTFRGSGGGVSALHDQPDYQRGAVPARLSERADGTLGRTVPDVAVNGDAETGLVIGMTQRFPDGTDRYAERRHASGESATAVFAALVALANDASGGPLGFLNPLLYATRGALHDVVPSGRLGARVRTDFVAGDSGETARVLKVFESYESNPAARGYDTSTGLGSPTPAWFARLPKA